MSSAQQLRCCWRSLSPFRVYPDGVPCQCHRSYQGSPTPPGRSCLSKPLLTLKFLHLPRVPVQCHPAQPAPAPAFPGTPGVSQLAHQGSPHWAVPSSHVQPQLFPASLGDPDWHAGDTSSVTSLWCSRRLGADTGSPRAVPVPAHSCSLCTCLELS